MRAKSRRRIASSGSDAEEAALLAGLRAGDDAAYERLLRAYSPRLLAVARRFLPSEDDAREAVAAFAEKRKPIFQGR